MRGKVSKRGVELYCCTYHPTLQYRHPASCGVRQCMTSSKLCRSRTREKRDITKSTLLETLMKCNTRAGGVDMGSGSQILKFKVDSFQSSWDRCEYSEILTDKHCQDKYTDIRTYIHSVKHTHAHTKMYLDFYNLYVPKCSVFFTEPMSSNIFTTKLNCLYKVRCECDHTE